MRKRERRYGWCGRERWKWEESESMTGTGKGGVGWWAMGLINYSFFSRFLIN